MRYVPSLTIKTRSGLVFFQSPGANAIDLSNAVRAKMNELSTRFPEDMKWAAPYDPTVFVRDSIRAVVQNAAGSGSVGGAGGDFCSCRRGARRLFR